MSVMTRRGWLAASAILPAAGALIALRSKAEFSAPVSGREVMRERYFPNVVLTTHEGKQVRFYDDLIKDKAVVINVMFASCNDACPLITANLTRVQELLADRMARDLFFYSITIDPEHDTPEILDLYAKSYGVGPGWLFLTGRPDDIEQLRQKLGYVDPNPELDEDKRLHSGMLRYGSEPLSQWASCQGGANPEWIAESISWVLPKANRSTG
jgi:protein SCO1/2